MPQHTGPLIDALEAHHVTHFDGDYWIVYRVAFETNERITGSPDVQALAAVRPRGRRRPEPPAVFVADSALGRYVPPRPGRLGIAFDATGPATSSCSNQPATRSTRT